MVIAGAFYPNYFLLGVIEEDLAVKELNGFNARMTVMVFSSFSVVMFSKTRALAVRMF